MGNGKSYKSKSFFGLALRFGFAFLIFIAFVELLIAVVRNGSFSVTFEQYFSKQTWTYFVKRIVILSAFYGVFMAGYYKLFKSGKQKSRRSKRSSSSSSSSSRRYKKTSE